jgi:hypothetical protein
MGWPLSTNWSMKRTNVGARAALILADPAVVAAPCLWPSHAPAAVCFCLPIRTRTPPPRAAPQNQAPPSMPPPRRSFPLWPDGQLYKKLHCLQSPAGRRVGLHGYLQHNPGLAGCVQPVERAARPPRVVRGGGSVRRAVLCGLGRAGRDWAMPPRAQTARVARLPGWPHSTAANRDRRPHTS